MNFFNGIWNIAGSGLNHTFMKESNKYK
jgi:hypothetical protein